MAVEGFSCTAFCYGQTGSGKTHTLTGPPDLVGFYIICLVRNINKKIKTVPEKTKCNKPSTWFDLPCVFVSLPNVKVPKRHTFRAEGLVLRNL